MPDPIDIPPYIPGRDRGRGRGQGKFHHTYNRSHRPTNTVTSVEWLSDEVIAAGLKDSTVFLHDVRSGGSALRLRHNGPVARICRVDEWRVVVGGVHSVFPPPLYLCLPAMVWCMCVLTIKSYKCTTCATHQQNPTQIQIPKGIKTTTVMHLRLRLQNPTSFSKITPRLISPQNSTLILNWVFLLMVRYPLD